MEDIGQQIRKERLRNRFTLEQLSQRTGLSKSFLSQIERGLAQPSVASLKKIALELGISVVRLFMEEGNGEDLWKRFLSFGEKVETKKQYSQDTKVVRADRRKGVTFPGSQVIYEVLTPDLNRQLEVMYMRISENQSSGDEPMIDPPGEKFGLVLRGTIEVYVGKNRYELGIGDTISHPADVPHSWRGLKGDPIEVIWVLTPPTF